MSKTYFLNNGIKIPSLGYGSWQSPGAALQNAIQDALDVGFRHFDCAIRYENQKPIGEGLKKSKVPREELFLTSKLWCTQHEPFRVQLAAETCLKELQTDYLDLFLIHWPVAFKYQKEEIHWPKDSEGKLEVVEANLLETWLAMEKLVQQGLVRSIGVSNFSGDEVAMLCKEGSILPATNQVEVHPYWSQDKLRAECDKYNVRLTSFSSLGNLTPHLPDAPTPMKNAEIMALAEKYGKSTPQVILRWGLQMGNIVLTRSMEKQQLQENFDIFDFELSDADMELIKEAGKRNQVRLMNPNYYTADGSLFYKDCDYTFELPPTNN